MKRLLLIAVWHFDIVTHVFQHSWETLRHINCANWLIDNAIFVHAISQYHIYKRHEFRTLSEEHVLGVDAYLIFLKF